MKNFWYLFVVYTLAWTLVFVCMVHLSKSNRRLKEELRRLHAQLARAATE